MRHLIFLDIDGVLHGDATPKLIHVPLFERVLAAMPQLEVVISSTWRMDQTLAQLRALFSPSLQSRIVDVTPVMTDGLDAGGRQLEIEQYLRDRGLTEQNARWRALDDWPQLFRADCPWLQKVDVMHGLDEADAAALVAWYREGRPSA